MLRIVIVLILSLVPAAALAGDGVQILPDASAIMVNEDVGPDRWAIRLELGDETPLNVSGNVFRSDGGDPAFVWCAIQDVVGSPDDIRNASFVYDCFGSDRCAAPPCSSAQWSFISRITLPGRFFLP
jgi:hypothetical protein